MKFQGRLMAIAGMLAAVVGVSLSLAQSEGTAKVEALSAARMSERLKPEGEDKESAFNAAGFLRARQQAIQNAAPRVGPLGPTLVLTPRIGYKKGAGYMKFEMGYLDAREDTFAMTLDSYVHVAFHMKKASRQILLLVNGEARDAGLRLVWGKGKMSVPQTVSLFAKGSKVIPLIVQTEAPGKYTIVFRIRREITSGSLSGAPFVFRSVEIIDLT